MYVNSFRASAHRRRDRRLLRRRVAPARVPRSATIRSPTRRSPGCSKRRRTRRAPRTASRGSSWWCAMRPRATIGDLTRRAWEAHGRAFSRRASRRSCWPTSTAARPAASRPRRCTHRRVRRYRARPRGDGPVVDLPGGAEPAARGDRARARQRAHHDHDELCGARQRSRFPGHVEAVAVVPSGPARETTRPSRPRAVRRAHPSRAVRLRVVAETPRFGNRPVLLRRWDVSGDLDAYAAICADPEVMRYIGDGSVASRAETAVRIEQYESTWHERGFGLFALERLDTGELIGNTGLAAPTSCPRCPRGRDRLAPRPHPLAAGPQQPRPPAPCSHSRGDKVGLDRIVSVHAVGNDASGHVMQKIGMHLDRETVHPKNGRAVRVLRSTGPLRPDGYRGTTRGGRRGSRRARACTRARRRTSGREPRDRTHDLRCRHVTPRTSACRDRARGACSGDADRHSRRRGRER